MMKKWPRDSSMSFNLMSNFLPDGLSKSVNVVLSGRNLVICKPEIILSIYLQRCVRLVSNWQYFMTGRQHFAKGG
jgi:hypothetical protein